MGAWKRTGVVDSASATATVTPRFWALRAMDDPVLEEDPATALPTVPTSVDDLVR